ncbi:cytochrome o ubiquinol oxidase subunit IV [Endozoicomonas numazuensis]|uniref:Cytochrome bo(3) ubiquinol oxidase subunit 4 n=1 Tax=Endozoicomonas numazuensis TaxID=1137799 RepID=A0A081NH00_9GAMM|nr:cytochrome o ubiquinol oxidase subunit IV [Endozoicomonas numazuensis]KEQ17723.1 cytochrome C oxidase [Endozoicomonas numazuensis]
MQTHEHSLQDYLTGLVLAVILTAIPFWVVWTSAFSAKVLFGIITLCALIQVIVHLRFFLNISLKHTGKDYLTALFFAGVLIFIMVGGTIWILYDLNFRMM